MSKRRRDPLSQIESSLLADAVRMRENARDVASYEAVTAEELLAWANANERAAETLRLLAIRLPKLNSHGALVAALKECSFRLATVIAAHGDFSEANAKACDMAVAALKLAEVP